MFLKYTNTWSDSNVLELSPPSYCRVKIQRFEDIVSIRHQAQPFKRRMKSHLPFANVIRRFNVYGSVHCKYIPIYIQQDTTLHSLFISGNCSTCFGWYFHPSLGAHTTASTASGICHNVTAICRYRGRVGTGLSVLWVCTAHSYVAGYRVNCPF
jgi:hypothetical protein